jgi:hypothetical protein
MYHSGNSEFTWFIFPPSLRGPIISVQELAIGSTKESEGDPRSAGQPC